MRIYSIILILFAVSIQLHAQEGTNDPPTTKILTDFGLGINIPVGEELRSTYRYGGEFLSSLLIHIGKQKRFLLGPEFAINYYSKQLEKVNNVRDNLFMLNIGIASNYCFSRWGHGQKQSISLRGSIAFTYGTNTISTSIEDFINNTSYGDRQRLMSGTGMRLGIGADLMLSEDMGIYLGYQHTAINFAVEPKVQSAYSANGITLNPLQKMDLSSVSIAFRYRLPLL